MIIPFATQSYKLPALPVSAQRCINIYAQAEPKDAKTPVVLYGSPGLVAFATCGTGPIRGMHTLDGVLYVVSGHRLYSVTSAGVSADIGGNISGTGVVSMDDNGSELVIVNGTNGYIYDTTSGFRLITDTDFLPANTVQFFDQRFVYDAADTNQFFISSSLDGTSYSSTEYASAEARPDNVKAVVLNGSILFVFGDRSTELWQDAGLANFPFERVPAGVVQRGLGAALCTAKEDNVIFFLGDDLSFYRSGVPPQRVSTHALESIWRGYATTSDAFAFAYTWNGHKFVCVTFPSANATFVLDVATGLWHERESRDMSNNALGRWRANCHVSHYGKELIGDAYNGTIGYLSASTFTEYGNNMVAQAISPPLSSDRKRMFMSRFELDVESGVGLTTGQGLDPQIMMDYSDDGGRTFINLQRWKSMGALGEFRKRLKWNRLGNSRDRMMRISISDPVPRTIIAAHADITLGQ